MERAAPGKLFFGVAATLAIGSGRALAAVAQAPLDMLETGLRRAGAFVCLLLTLAWLATRIVAARKRPPFHDSSSEPSLAGQMAIFWGLITGALLAIDAFEQFALRFGPFRIVPPRGLVWQSLGGLIDASALVVAVVFAAAASRDPHRVTGLFVTLAVFACWLALFLAPYDGATGSHDAAAILAFLLSVLLAVFIVAQGVLGRRNQKRAWPEELWRLTEGYPVWRGFRSAAGALGFGILILGGFAASSAATPVSAVIAAFATYGLLSRQWDWALAWIAAGLTTLASVSLPLVLFAPPAGAEFARAAPVLWNIALFGFAYMTFHWHWLASFWEQQLLDGQPWTTAGHLIPIARQAGFLSGVFGLLAALQMSLWPAWMLSHSRDNTAGRWVAGLAGLVALTAALMVAAWMTQRRNRMGLMILSVFIAGLFVAVRIDFFGG